METEIMTQPNANLSARDLQARVNLIQEVMKSVMKNGTHYGVIPGCPKPSLYKPGAEILAMTFAISVESVVETLSIGDEKRYRVTCTAFTPSGVRLGSAVGECSSGEEKYKWRKPVCDAEWEESPTDRRREKWKMIKGFETKVKQVRMESDDQANTILQMADKRAYVSVIRKVTAASDIFTQDIQDLEYPVTDGETEPTKFRKIPQPTQEALDPAGFKTIKSKFDGTCKSCNGPVKAGDEVLYNPKLKGVYHPACLNPKETPTDAKAPEVTKKVLENLEKMASASGKKLIDRIGVDGLERLDQITPAYAQELLAEYAALLDERQAK